MAKRRVFRYTILMVAVLLLISAYYYFYCQEQSVCMGVKILSENEYAQLQYDESENVEALILQDDVPVAMDTESATIYIAQDIDERTYLAELNGVLSMSNEEYSLAFAPDDAFVDLYTAMAEGHSFELLITKAGICCKELQVVFTNLPVIKLAGEGDIFTKPGAAGEIVIWTPSDPDIGKYSVKTSYARWHVRGATSRKLDKKSLKLNLKDESGNNSNLALLGMGEDDDWILNAMATDDLKIREVTVGSVWEKIQESSLQPYKMACGMYVEVIANDCYQGLYLLQRRIDDKYLELNSNQILCKGWSYTPPLDNILEVKYCLYSEDLQKKLALTYYENHDPEHIQLDNWIDVHLLVKTCCLADNGGLSNMYYLWTFQQENYSISLIPWDTDMAFGYGWVEGNGVTYLPTIYTSKTLLNRHEYKALKYIYPNLDTIIAERWKQLRDNGLSAEYLRDIIELYKNQLVNSGAYKRDMERYGVRNNYADTFEALQIYIDEHFDALDSYFEY